MKDFLEHLNDLYGFDRDFIRQIASGKHYFAVELVNGNIGVCATLERKLDSQIPENIDIQNIDHRIILTAYFNALLNYRSENIVEAGDITGAIDLHKYKNIHIIGQFKPVFERLEKMGIAFTYSDLRDIQAPDNKIKNQKHYLQAADCLIISATAIYNKTFNTLLENSPNSDKYILGPTATMSPELCYWGIKASFGVQFKLYDSRVLGLIAQDYGTKYFLKLGKKVALICDSTQDL